MAYLAESCGVLTFPNAEKSVVRILSIEYAINVLMGSERDGKLVWDGLVKRVGNRGERERKKKTREWIGTVRAFKPCLRDSPFSGSAY